MPGRQSTPWLVGWALSAHRASNFSMPKEPVPTLGRKRRPASAPSSPRSRSPAVEAPLVQLSKVEASRLTLEAENFAWRTQHKQATAERQEKARQRFLLSPTSKEEKAHLAEQARAAQARWGKG